MSIAYLPSPSRDVWHLGVIPVRAWALCTVLGIVAAIWLARWRYRAAGGQPRVITDVAAWAVPLGIAGARLYSVLTDYQLYFGKHADWVTMARVWDGALGLPGALLLGFAGAAIACRRAAVPLAPVLAAAAPAVAAGQAIGCWGDWFSQQLYGRPSSLPWALEIAPAHRLNGYETFATFQPVFLYQCLWDLLAAAVVIWAARRFRLTGDRAFAVYVAAFSVGMFLTQTVRADYSHHLLGLRTDEWAALVGLAGAAWYLYRTRHADPLAHLRPPGHPASRRGKPAAPANPAAAKAPVTPATPAGPAKPKASVTPATAVSVTPAPPAPSTPPGTSVPSAPAKPVTPGTSVAEPPEAPAS